jgi:hypothetical protein
MSGTILKTDGPNNHDPARWAAVTADQIVEIGEEVDSTTVKEAKAFQAAIVSLLTAEHATVQKVEAARLAAVPDATVGQTPASSGPHLDHVASTTAAIVAAAGSYSFASWFQTAAVQKYVSDVLTTHFNTSADIERKLFADANPSNPAATLYKAAHQTGSAV